MIALTVKDDNGQVNTRIFECCMIIYRTRLLMRLVLLILVSIAFHYANGQFAIVDDKDGFVNIRTSAENKNNVIDTLHNGHLVWCFEPEGNWVSVDYSKKGSIQTGYVYRDRVKYLKAFESLPINRLDKERVTHQKDSVKITITAADFIPRNNRLHYSSDNNGKFLSKINGKAIWGTDGNIPKRQYGAIEVQMGSKHIKIPFTALENLFEPNLNYSECFYDSQKDIVYISALNSDGAGGYVVVWTIEKGKYTRRFVAHGF